MAARHLLIVDDSVTVADALRIVFEAAGYRVSVAHAVAAAVEQIVVGQPDVMMLDLTLPDGDGLTVLARARERGHVRLPITLALTGHADDATQERCLAAGCRAVLVKPVPTRELREVVRALEIDHP